MVTPRAAVADVDAYDAAYEIAAATPDPELPVVTIGDLGILRDVVVHDGVVEVTITPTYSGCPAMREIAADVSQRLTSAGYGTVTVRTQLAPAWTTDWITADGRRKLAESGIAPPTPVRTGGAAGRVAVAFGPPPAPHCPHCGSPRTSSVAAFSATACKSLHRCDECAEPFEAVKPF